MAVLETLNVALEVWLAAVGLQVGVTFGAALIAHGGDRHASAMFRVACGAIGSFCGSGMVCGAIMASEASAIGGFCGKRVSLLKVASGALFFEDGMRGRHSSAAVDAVVAADGVPRNPRDGQSGRENTHQQLGALEWRRPLEIVQVDALREFFGCACTCHDKSFQSSVISSQ